MMRVITPLLVWSWVGLVAVTATSAFQDGPTADVPELKVLDHWLGNWETTLREKSVGADRVGKGKAEWVLGGRFMKQAWTLDADAVGPAMSGESLMTFDPEEHVYRSWSFDSTGGTTQATGRWDAASKTMTWTGTDPSRDLTTITTARFDEDGVETWTVVIKGKDGATLADVEGTNRRRK